MPLLLPSSEGEAMMNFDSDEGKALTYEDSSRSSAHVQHVQPAGRRCFSRGLEPCRSRYIHSSRRGQLLTCSLSESTPPHRDYTCYALASSFCHRAYAKFQGARLSSFRYVYFSLLHEVCLSSMRRPSTGVPRGSLLPTRCHLNSTHSDVAPWATLSVLWPSQ